jgi:hypothetical protein
MLSTPSAARTERSAARPDSRDSRKRIGQEPRRTRRSRPARCGRSGRPRGPLLRPPRQPPAPCGVRLLLWHRPPAHRDVLRRTAQIALHARIAANATISDGCTQTIAEHELRQSDPPVVVSRARVVKEHSRHAPAVSIVRGRVGRALRAQGRASAWRYLAREPDRPQTCREVSIQSVPA